MRQLLERLEDSFANLDAFVYEHRVRTHFLLRLMQTFGMEGPAIIFHQEGLIAPAMNRLFQQVPQAGLVHRD
jgi:hypothetical protein